MLSWRYMTTLVRFRRDLRLADHAALLAAVESGGPVIPVFIWAPEEDAPWAPGSASRWWLHRSLKALSESLAGYGSRLIIRRGPTKETLLRLAAETGAEAIFWNRLYEPATMARDKELKQDLRSRGFVVKRFPGNLLFEPWTLHNSSGRPFSIFTAFYKACLSAPAPAQPEPAPRSIPGPLAWPPSLAPADLKLEPELDWAGGLRETWQPGEKSAGAQLDLFLRHGARDYLVERDR